MGYGNEQMRNLEVTINNTPCDLVVVGTPIDLTRLLKIKHPMARVRYELQVIGRPTLEEIIGARFRLTYYDSVATVEGFCAADPRVSRM